MNPCRGVDFLVKHFDYEYLNSNILILPDFISNKLHGFLNTCESVAFQATRSIRLWAGLQPVFAHIYTNHYKFHTARLLCVSNIQYIRTYLRTILVTIILMDGSHWNYIRLEDVWRKDQKHWADAHVFETPQWWCSTTLIVCERICVRVCVRLCKSCL